MAHRVTSRSSWRSSPSCLVSVDLIPYGSSLVLSMRTKIRQSLFVFPVRERVLTLPGGFLGLSAARYPLVAVGWPALEEAAICA